MKLKALAEAVMWLPGFAPDEDPIEVLGVAGERREAARKRSVQRDYSIFRFSPQAKHSGYWEYS